MAAHKSRVRRRFTRFLKKNLSVKIHKHKRHCRDRAVIPIKPIYIEEESKTEGEPHD